MREGEVELTVDFCGRHRSQIGSTKRELLFVPEFSGHSKPSKSESGDTIDFVVSAGIPVNTETPQMCYHSDGRHLCIDEEKTKKNVTVKWTFYMNNEDEQLTGIRPRIRTGEGNDTIYIWIEQGQRSLNYPVNRFNLGIIETGAGEDHIYFKSNTLSQQDLMKRVLDLFLNRFVLDAGSERDQIHVISEKAPPSSSKNQEKTTNSLSLSLLKEKAQLLTKPDPLTFRLAVKMLKAISGQSEVIENAKTTAVCSRGIEKTVVQQPNRDGQFDPDNGIFDKIELNKNPCSRLGPGKFSPKGDLYRYDLVNQAKEEKRRKSYTSASDWHHVRKPTKNRSSSTGNGWDSARTKQRDQWKTSVTRPLRET